MTEEKSTYTYEEAFEKSKQYFGGDELAAKVFLDKYALRNKKGALLENSPDKMHRRLSKEFARIEKNKFKKPLTENEIYKYLKDFKYIIPGGSGLSGIGNKNKYVSLSNCFVGKSPLDSYSSILKTDEEIVSISKRRGGIGFDMSNLRPAGSRTSNASNTSTGIVPFCERYSNTIREVGQCLFRDTMVLSSSGLKLISEIKTGDTVWTKQKWATVNKIIKNKKPCVEIKTKHGKKIICSKEHVFHSTNGEKRAVDFKIGDAITQIVGDGWEGEDIHLDCQPYEKNNYNNSNRLNTDVSLPKILDEKLSYVLGYSYGDGYVGQQRNGKNMTLSLSCADDWKDIKTKLSNNIKEIFDYQVKIETSPDAYENLRIFSRLILDFLAKNNILKQKAGNLIFPNKILKAKKDVIFAFLSGYFDADRCAQKSKKVYKIASIDNEFLLIIQNILSAFGVVSKIHKFVRNQENWHDIYSLSINGGKSQDIFKKLMSQSIKIKDTFIESKCRDQTKSIYKTSDFKTIASRHNYLMSNDQYLSYSICDRLQTDLEVTKDIFLLQDEICSIEEYEDGEKQEVYDLCLDKEHLFFANGLYAHNSGRRGALILTLSVHHPEIMNFITMKQDLQKINGANISVKLTDEFLHAVEKEEKYEQRWPVEGSPPSISNMVSAKEIWNQIVKSAWCSAEPGILLWDNIIRESPADCYPLFKSTSTNPCSELPLSERDSCRLLLLNSYSFVDEPFAKNAKFNFKKFYKYSQIAQRLMDDLIDLEIENINSILKKINNDPEPEEIKRDEIDLWNAVKKACRDGRRTGTGLNAIGDTIAACGLEYGSEESIDLIEKIFKTLKLGCYRSSVNMAKEIGPFKAWNHDLEKNNPFLLRMKNEDSQLWNDMKKYGRRNIGLLTMAPSGSVSILTRTTSGIEPLFQTSYIRRKKININDENIKVDFIDDSGDKWQNFEVIHPKIDTWKEVTKKDNIEQSPWFGCCAEDINWANRVKLQAMANRNIDHSISSTVNLPESATIEDISNIYTTAWKSGCKGITVYRKNCRTGVIVDKNQNDNNFHIVQTDSPKRPKTLSCDVYHPTVKGEKYFVIIGLLDNKQPYEVFAGRNKDFPQNIKKAVITKHKRGVYRLYDIDKEQSIIYDNISDYIDEEQEAITRLISSNLRHGCSINFVVHQLEKTKGDLMGFAKAVCRILKKYIPENTEVSGEECPDCRGKLIRIEGCMTCTCGFSKCG